jgi:hypothetical protein
MAGNYPDGVTQADIDRAGDEAPDEERCSGCGALARFACEPDCGLVDVEMEEIPG